MGYSMREPYNKTFVNSTHREVHVVELTDERLHPGLILFVGLFVHLKHDSQKKTNQLQKPDTFVGSTIFWRKINQVY